MKSKKLLMIVMFGMLVFGLARGGAAASAKEAGSATMSAVSAETSKAEASKKDEQPSYTKSELRLMSAIINCEAGAESYQGKLAVGIVIMNRISSKAFPNTLHKVIYQRRQFSPVRNGMLKKKLAEYDAGKTNTEQWQDCIRAAKSVMEGQDYITYKGSRKNMKSFHFFSVYLSGARFRLGGHRFK